MDKVHIILMCRNTFEDASWSNMMFYSPNGHNSIQKFVEDIASAFKEAMESNLNAVWLADHCKMSKKAGFKFCGECGRRMPLDAITKEMATNIVDEVFQGTLQNLGELWDYLNKRGITTAVWGKVDCQVVSIQAGPELIVETIFGDGIAGLYSTETLEHDQSVKRLKD